MIAFSLADMGRPLRLRQQGRATTVAMFTRNVLCAVATPQVGLTTANFLDMLLNPGIKLGPSTPKADPAGDYTWALFRLADRLRPGSFREFCGTGPKSPANCRRDPPPSAPQWHRPPAVTALRDGVVDIHLGYCTSARLRLSQMPTRVDHAMALWALDKAGIGHLALRLYE